MTAVQMLKLLREWFNAPSTRAEERQALWDVLSALRGPDRRSQRHLKPVTTSVIRGALGIRDDSIGSVAVVSEDGPQAAEVRMRVGTDGHFLEHCAKAFYVLELSWKGPNGRLAAMGPKDSAETAYRQEAAPGARR